MTTMLSIDENIARALDLISRCGMELNGLCQTADELIESALTRPKGGAEYCFDGDIVQKNKFDPSGWMISASAKSFGLKRNRKADGPERYLGYQISLFGEEIPSGSGMPLIHVFLWDGPADFTNYSMAFPLDLESTSLDQGRLFCWCPEDGLGWQGRQWTYSLQLTAMNSRQDLVQSLLEPALALLAGKTTLEALPDSLSGLVRYPPEVLSC